MTPNPINPDLVPTVAEGWFNSGGRHPEGCQLCIQGMKMVYFMGGDCSNPSHCRWYCPISSERKPATAHFADEVPIPNPESLGETLKILMYEARAIGAEGMSFTGGDPLSTPRKVDQVCAIIHAMKIEFGNTFHCHLYTSGVTFDSLTAEKLHRAKLDALRFHPDEKDFPKIQLAMGYHYTVGAEVPVIPTEKNHEYLLNLADYLASIGADYLNLNEFEMCAPNQVSLLSQGFELASATAATVKGSREYALRFLSEFTQKSALTVHFCPVALKDSVQIRKRYIRRAEHIKYDYEEISVDGCLLFLRVQGSVQEISRLYTELLEEAHMPDKLLGYFPTKGILDVPPFLSDDETFRALLATYKVKAGVYETLPFREPKLAQIREYSPIQAEE